MGLLSWLGLKEGDAYPNLDALMAELRRALPEDESVVIRYIAIVIVLLGQVAYADGRFTEGEEATLRRLLEHVDRFAPSSIDAVCASLRGNLTELREEERALCYRELKSLCDSRERVEVMRLLVRLAAADGAVSPQEASAIRAIGAELAVPMSEIEALEEEARAEETPAS